jgi:hypothetical protein
LSSPSGLFLVQNGESRFKVVAEKGEIQDIEQVWMNVLERNNKAWGQWVVVVVILVF